MAWLTGGTIQPESKGEPKATPDTVLKAAPTTTPGQDDGFSGQAFPKEATNEDPEVPKGQTKPPATLATAAKSDSISSFNQPAEWSMFGNASGNTNSMNHSNNTSGNFADDEAAWEPKKNQTFTSRGFGTTAFETADSSNSLGIPPTAISELTKDDFGFPKAKLPASTAAIRSGSVASNLDDGLSQPSQHSQLSIQSPGVRSNVSRTSNRSRRAGRSAHSRATSSVGSDRSKRRSTASVQSNASGSTSVSASVLTANNAKPAGTGPTPSDSFSEAKTAGSDPTATTAATATAKPPPPPQEVDESSIEGETEISNHRRNDRFTGSFHAKQGLLDGSGTDSRAWDVFPGFESSNNNLTNNGDGDDPTSTPHHPFPPFSTEEVSPMTQDFGQDPPFGVDKDTSALGNRSADDTTKDEPFPGANDSDWDAFHGTDSVYSSAQEESLAPSQLGGATRHSVQERTDTEGAETPTTPNDASPKDRKLRLTDQFKSSSRRLDGAHESQSMSGVESSAVESSALGSTARSSDPSSSTTEPTRNGTAREREEARKARKNDIKWNSGLADILIRGGSSSKDRPSETESNEKGVNGSIAKGNDQSRSKKRRGGSKSPKPPVTGAVPADSRTNRGTTDTSEVPPNGHSTGSGVGQSVQSRQRQTDEGLAQQLVSPRRKVGENVGQPALPQMHVEWDADADENVGDSGEKARPFEEPLHTVVEPEPDNAGQSGSVPEGIENLNIANDPRAQEMLILYLKSMGTSTKTAKVIASSFVEKQKMTSEPSSANPSPGTHNLHDTAGIAATATMVSAEDPNSTQEIATTTTKDTREMESASGVSQPQNMGSSLVSGSAGMIDPNTGNIMLDPANGMGDPNGMYGMQPDPYNAGQLGWPGGGESTVGVGIELTGAQSMYGNQVQPQFQQQQQQQQQQQFAMQQNPYGTGLDQYPTIAPGGGQMLVAGGAQVPSIGGFGMGAPVSPGVDPQLGFTQQGQASPMYASGGNEAYYFNNNNTANMNMNMNTNMNNMAVNAVQNDADYGGYNDDLQSVKGSQDGSGARKYILFCLIIIVIGIGAAAAILVRESNRPVGEDTTAPSSSPSQQPSMISEDIFDSATAISGLDALRTEGSPQRRAVGWMSTFDTRNDATLTPAFIQRYALVVLYFSTTGDEWNMTERWLDPDLHECGWSDTINCIEDPRDSGLDPVVNGLDLTKNNLVGSLPNEIGRLSQLDFLRMSQNRLQGTLPSSLFSGTNITVVDVHKNMLNGTLPNSIADAVDLMMIDLSQNAMTGPLPDGFYDLTALRYANLGQNQFSGPLPTDLGKLQRLTNLLLGSNRLTGTLPTLTFGVIPELQVVELNDNGFTGPVPEWIFEPGRQQVSLSQNMLSGTIQQPSTTILDSSDLRLQGVDLSHNMLSGTVPSWLELLTSLRSLDLSHNLYRGNVPSWGGTSVLTNLEDLRLAHNKLTGTIPTEIGMLSSLAGLSLATNGFQGNLPTEMGNLNRLREFFPSP